MAGAWAPGQGKSRDPNGCRTRTATPPEGAPRAGAGPVGAKWALQPARRALALASRNLCSGSRCSWTSQRSTSWASSQSAPPVHDVMFAVAALKPRASPRSSPPRSCPRPDLTGPRRVQPLPTRRRGPEVAQRALSWPWPGSRLLVLLGAAAGPLPAGTGASGGPATRWRSTAPARCRARGKPTGRGPPRRRCCGGWHRLPLRPRRLGS